MIWSLGVVLRLFDVLLGSQHFPCVANGQLRDEFDVVVESGISGIDQRRGNVAIWIYMYKACHLRKGLSK